MSYNGREFLREVIKKYREHPCLWKVTHIDYHDKTMRNKALDDFLDLFRSVDPTANRETILKKLASIRSSFNKEQRKVKVSLTSESGSQDIHVPKLWYFDHLKFLADQDTPQRSVTTSSLLDYTPPIIIKEEDDFTVDNTSESSSESSAVSPAKTKNFKRLQPKDDHILEKIAKRMDQPMQVCASATKLPHDAFGEHIAEKLRGLPPSMVPICQKLINDSIFLAEIQHLNINSRIVTD